MNKTDIEILKTMLIKRETIKSDSNYLKLEDTTDGLKAMIISIESNKLYQETRDGYNLIDTSDIKNKTENGITLTNNNDGSLTLDGTSSETNGYYNVLKSIGDLKAGDYTFSLNSNKLLENADWYIDLRTYDGTKFTSIMGNGVKFNENSKTFTLTEDKLEVYLIIWINKSLILDNYIVKLMLIEGAEEKEFEQYGKMPSKKYTSEVMGIDGDNKVKIGNNNLITKNLISQTKNGITASLNNDGSIHFTGTVTEGNFTFDVMSKVKTFLKKGVTYTLSAGIDLPGNVYLRVCNNASNNYPYFGVGQIENPRKLTFTYNDDFDTGYMKCFVWFNSSTTGITYDFTIYPMLETGDTETEYIENQLQVKQIDLYSKTLYGKEIVRDKIVRVLGKWKYYLSWYKLVLNGTENFVYDSTYKYFRISNYDFNGFLPSKDITLNQYSNMLKQETNWANFRDNIDIDSLFYSIHDDGYNMAIRMLEFNNVDEFKSYLAEQYANGTPLYFVYQLSEPVYEEIIDENLLAQLNSILTNIKEYNDITHIEFDKEIVFEILIEKDKIKLLERENSELNQLILEMEASKNE